MAAEPPRSLRTRSGKEYSFLATLSDHREGAWPSQIRDDLVPLFDQFLLNNPDFFYIFDADQRFLYVSPALLELWGLPLDVEAW